jgi:hypothetical protein
MPAKLAQPYRTVVVKSHLACHLAMHLMKNSRDGSWKDTMLAFSSVMKLIQKGCKVEISSGLFSFPVFTLHRSGWHPESNSCSRRVSASKVLGRELHRYQQLPGQCVIIYLANCLRVIDVHHCHGLGLHVLEGQPLMSGTEYKVQFAQNLQEDTSMGLEGLIIA